MNFLHALSISDFLKTFIALLVIINPPAVIPAYLSLTNGMGETTLKKVYKMVSHSVFFVLAISALAGELILKAFGISLDSFQIGGGILLAIIAYGMMNAENKQHTQTEEEEKESIAKGESISVVPLTIPLLTGPGSMSVCVITASKYHSLVGYLYILVSAILISFMVYFILKSAPKIREKMGTTGMNVMSKVFSLLLMALAIELIGSGLGNMFPGLIK
jgi:multiple antibiotic resistance protein